MTYKSLSIDDRKLILSVLLEKIIKEEGGRVYWARDKPNKYDDDITAIYDGYNRYSVEFMERHSGLQAHFVEDIQCPGRIIWLVVDDSHSDFDGRAYYYYCPACDDFFWVSGTIGIFRTR